MCGCLYVFAYLNLLELATVFRKTLKLSKEYLTMKIICFIFYSTDCASVTKGLITYVILSSIAFNIPLSTYRQWFQITYHNVFEVLQVRKHCMFAISAFDRTFTLDLDKAE